MAGYQTVFRELPCICSMPGKTASSLGMQRTMIQVRLIPGLLCYVIL